MKMLKVKYKKGNYMDIYLDDEDFDKYKDYNLTINISRGKTFVNARLRLNVDNCYLHRLILNCEKKDKVEFLDGNRLNLTRLNLRIMDVSPEAQEQKRKVNYEINREKRIEQSRIHYLNNKGRANENARNRRKGVKVERKKKDRSLKSPIIIDPIDKILRHKLKQVRSSAKQRDLEFDISFDFYKQLIQKGCSYTGENLLAQNGGSLDRIDNDKGYTEDNVLPCCCWVNIMRGNHLTVQETIIAVNAVLEYRNREKTNG